MCNYLNEKTNMQLEDLKKKQESVLQVFKQAKSDLEDLNGSIDEAISINISSIDKLILENGSLLELKAGGHKACKFLSKLF